MDHLSILQISKQQQVSSVPSAESLELQQLIAKLEALAPYDKVVFETCLRKIYFFQTDKVSLDSDGVLGCDSSHRLYSGSAAIDFLLQLLCGLHSRILGETEIFGQFKEFIKRPEVVNSFLFINPGFVRFITGTVKEARETYIRHWGVKSYGSIIRKWAKNETEISIFGAGNLTQEILPWLIDKKQERNVKIYVRNPEKYVSLKQEYLGIEILPIAEFIAGANSTANLATNLIVAAPIATEGLLQLLSPQMRLVDCRGIDKDCVSLKGLVSEKVELLELQDIFSQLEGEQARSQEGRHQVEEFLGDKMLQFLNREAHRPMGWEDLCA
jgi:glutamyl-tRNA reductase